MKLSSFNRILGLGLVLFALWVIASLAYTWELQWSIDTGRERTIHRIYGFQTSVDSPKDTIISEWLNATTPDGNWKTVAKSQPSVLPPMISYSYSRIYGHFRSLQRDVQDPEVQQKFARLVLDEIAAGPGTNSVSPKCNNVREKVQKLSSERFFPREPVTFEELKTFWDQEQREN